jgi:hypothetical protein
MDRDFLFDLYKNSWSRRDQLASEVALPLAVLPLLWGSLIFLARSAPWTVDAGLLRVALIAIFAAAILTFSRAVWYLLRSYHGYEYVTIPLATELLRYRAGINSAYQSVPDGERLARQEFDRSLVGMLADATDVNTRSNERRAAELHAMRRSVAQTTIHGCC